MQENYIHPECSQSTLMNIKCAATPSTRTTSVLNHNPQLPYISTVFEGSPFLPTFKTVSTINCLYRYHYVRYLASMGHGNGEIAISALSLRKKKHKNNLSSFYGLSGARKEAFNKNCLPAKILQLPQFPILSTGRQGDGNISDTTKW